MLFPQKVAESLAVFQRVQDTVVSIEYGDVKLTKQATLLDLAQNMHGTLAANGPEDGVRTFTANYLADKVNG